MLRLRSILTTLLIACICISGLAQDYVPLTLNPKLGINFSDLIVSGPERISSSAKMGWNLGLDVRYGTNFLFKGGIHYYQTGSAWQIADSIMDMEKFTAHQLKMPLGAGIKVLRVDYFNLWVFADAVVNYTIQVKNETEKHYIDYPKTGLSGRLGVGIDLSRFTMDIALERSFTDLLSDLSAHNQLVNLSFGIKL